MTIVYVCAKGKYMLLLKNKSKNNCNQINTSYVRGLTNYENYLSTYNIILFIADLTKNKGDSINM